jgi:hypothetical protein
VEGMHEFSSKEKMTQCFKDIGCEDEIMNEFMKCFDQDKDKVLAQINLLIKQRRYLLDQLHTAQKRIDCIDYMIYQLEQEKKHKRSNQLDD